MIMEVAIINGR